MKIDEKIMGEELIFERFVAGKPEPAGSKKGFPMKRKTGKIGVVVLDANPKAKDWKKIVAAECLEFGTSTTTEASDLLAGPITVCFCF